LELLSRDQHLVDPEYSLFESHGRIADAGTINFHVGLVIHVGRRVELDGGLLDILDAAELLDR
jgi:hypothetical protein